MNKPIQLTLWPDDGGAVTIACTHCGTHIDVLPQLQRRQDEVEQAVLQHPRVKALRERTREFLVAALPVLLYSSEPVGVTQLADEAGYSVSGAYWQVGHLLKQDILIAEIKRSGGTYHQYRLRRLNGHC